METASKTARTAPGFEEVIAAPAPSKARIVGQSPDATAYASGAFSGISFAETRYLIETAYKNIKDMWETLLDDIMYVSVFLLISWTDKTSVVLQKHPNYLRIMQRGCLKWYRNIFRPNSPKITCTTEQLFHEGLRTFSICMSKRSEPKWPPFVK